MARCVSRVHPLAKHYIRTLLVATLLLSGTPGLTFAAQPVAVPDGYPSAVTSFYGSAPSARLGLSIAYDDDYVVTSEYTRNTVMVYRRTSAGLVLESTITSSTGDFGYDVDISGDALIVGAPEVSGDHGAAYIYERTGTTWTLALSIPGSALGHLGHSVAIDGDSAVMGEPWANSGDGGLVFCRKDAGSWAISGSAGGDTDETLGRVVAVSGDLVAAGAPGHNSAHGRIRSYEYASGTWTQIGVRHGLYPTSAFGRSVSIDGDTIAAGISRIGADNLGAVWTFSAHGTDPTPTAVTPATSLSSNEQFGHSVHIEDGMLVVGSPYYSSGRGRIRVFEGNLAGWTETASFISPTGGSNHNFGTDVAAQGTTVLVGEGWSDFSGPDAGAFHEFSVGWTTTSEETTLTVAAPGVLGNDYDDDLDPLEAHLVTETGNGTLTLTTNGAYTYVPDKNFEGWDAFWYRTFDGTDYTLPTMASIYVVPVDDPPVISEGETITVTCDEDQSPTPFALALNAQDPDVGDTLTWSLTAPPSSGTATATGTGTRCEVEYTPFPDFYGTDTFVVRVSDATLPSALTDEITVSVTVNPRNDAPTFDLSPVYFGFEDEGAVSMPNWVTAIDPGAANESGQALQLSAVASVPEIFAVQPSISATGTLTFELLPNASGTCTVDVGLTDDDAAGVPHSLTTTHTMLIDILSIPDTPTPLPDLYQVEESNALFVSNIDGALANDTDVDGDPLTAELVRFPTSGAIFFFDDGAFIYAPNEGFCGTDQFAYRVSDGLLESEPVTVTVEVLPVEHDPMIDQGNLLSRTLAEDTTLTIRLSATDTDGDVLSWSIVDQADDGTAYAAGTGASTEITYCPNPDHNGEDAFSVAVTDISGRTDVIVIQVDITPVNDPPTFTPGDSLSVPEDAGPVEVEAWAKSVSCGPVNESQAVHFECTTDPPSIFTTAPSISPTGTLTFESAPNANGTATVTLLLCDDDTAGGSSLESSLVTFSVEISPVNDAPIASGDEFSVSEDETLSVGAPGILDDDTDIDRDPLSATLDTTPTCGTVTIAPDGSFAYRPYPNFNGTDSFTYLASDAQTSSPPATVTITVHPENDAPNAIGEAFTTDEGATLSVEAPGLLMNDTDIDGEELYAVVATGPEHGDLVMGAAGDFEYTPELGWSGFDSFTYVASDGEAQSPPAVVEITVIPVDTTYSRIAGEERFATAVSASRQAFPARGMADAVIVATAYNWPDALAGSGLAGATNASILLAQRDALPPSTASEILRLAPDKAYLLGGEGVVSDDVFVALEELLGEGNVKRLGGSDRYDTARQVAEETIAELGGAWDGTMMLATGRDFPDAVAASPLSAAAGWPIMLVRPGELSPTVASEIASTGTSHTVILGGAASVGAQSEGTLLSAGLTAERVSGSDRYSTSVAIASYGARHTDLGWGTLGIATGTRFPDALAGGVALACRKGLLLLNPCDSLNPVVQKALEDKAGSIDHVILFGGEGAVSEDVQSSIYGILR